MKIVFLLFFYLSAIANTFIYNEKFIYQLKNEHKTNKKNYSKNVIQGISFISKNKFVTTQTIKKNHSFIVNIFSFKNSKPFVIFSQEIPYSSHAQDVSYYFLQKQLHIITTGKQWQGVVDFVFINNKFHLYKEYLLNIGKNTPTLSENKFYLLTKANNSIYIYRFKDLKNNTMHPIPIFSFVLSKKQREKSQWLQGLAMKENYIYALSGDNTLKGKKYLYIYDSFGKVVKKFEVFIGKQRAKKEGKKWELEGLSFLNNKLYTTVMTGFDGKNNKYLYQILEIQ